MSILCSISAIKELPRTINIYIYMYIGSLCFDFSVVVERDINIGSRKKTTLSSRQACFVISHSSGDFNLLLPIFISHSTLTYRALYYGKIETQTS